MLPFETKGWDETADCKSNDTPKNTDPDLFQPKIEFQMPPMPILVLLTLTKGFTHVSAPTRFPPPVCFT